MAREGIERRLAAIMSADVAGYSRLMGVDEAGTLSALKALRKDVFAPQVTAHKGRVVKLMGDGALVEFPSFVNAVDCGIAVQRVLAERASGEQIKLRIGINLGDIIIEGSDIYGDGVNVAARFQEVAEPGGVALSGSAFDQVSDKVEATFTDDGEHDLKNIAKPVRVYRWYEGDPAPAGAEGDLPLSDKPSVAIRPFTNMSGDPEQEYFSDGITEDIITELSRFRSLFVIARNSSFVFKGQAFDVTDVAKKLGVQYIVEGSVRKAGNRVRITAQLIDAKTGKHLWADRYDRDLEDVFAVQDEVVSVVAGKIPGVLDRIGVDFARRKPPENATAFDCMLRGRWALHHTSEGTSAAIEFLEQAIAADENFAAAHALLAYAYSYAIFTFGFDPEVATERSCAHAARAVTLDSVDPNVNAVAAIGYLLSGRYELADVHSERAVAGNPNDQMVLYSRGLIFSYLGRAAEATPFFEQMERVDPYAPDDVRAEGYCDCLFMLGEYEKMVEIYQRWPDLPVHLHLVKAAALAKLGRIDEARASVDEYNNFEGSKQDPSTFVKLQTRMVRRREDRERWLDGYRKAGIEV